MRVTERGDEERRKGSTALPCKRSVLVRAALPCSPTLRSTAKKRASGKRRSAEKDKRNSTYLAYFSAYVLPELIETSRQGHLVTTSHSILARQFVHRVPDVIALQQIPNSIIRIIGVLFLSLSFSFTTLRSRSLNTSTRIQKKKRNKKETINY